MCAFTQEAQDLVSFTSRIDKKGRALISARIRKILKLSYGSRIFIKVNNSDFISKIDERGRFSIPSKIRRDSLFVEGKIGNMRAINTIQVLTGFKKKINGCSGVEDSMEVCETSEVGAIPTCNPKTIGD